MVMDRIIVPFPASGWWLVTGGWLWCGWRHDILPARSFITAHKKSRDSDTKTSHQSLITGHR